MADEIVLEGELSLEIPIDGEIGEVMVVRQYDAPVYDGATEVTPSEETQILQTADHAMVRNIVINPIPSNYGKITWNGSVLTVS